MLKLIIDNKEYSVKFTSNSEKGENVLLGLVSGIRADKDFQKITDSYNKVLYIKNRLIVCGVNAIIGEEKDIIISVDKEYPLVDIIAR